MKGQADINKQMDHKLAPPMFWLSLVVLGLFASLIYLNDLEHDGVIVFWCLVGLALLYPIFWIETGVHFFAGSRFMRQHIWFCLLPITRIGCRDHETGQEIWLPRLGWREINKTLERMLSRKFSIPMIAVALMVLPIIIMEFFYRDFVDRNLGLRIALSIAEAFIWAAFTFEFILMIKIVRSKVAYARKHWIDLAVILLPMLAFMRMMRLASVGRLNQLSRTAKVFRLRGLGMRLWRAFVALEIIEMLLYRNPERRLEKLEDQLEIKMEEVGFLRTDIQRLRERVAKREAEVEEERKREAARGTEGSSEISSDPNDRTDLPADNKTPIEDARGPDQPDDTDSVRQSA